MAASAGPPGRPSPVITSLPGSSAFRPVAGAPNLGVLAGRVSSVAERSWYTPLSSPSSLTEGGDEMVLSGEGPPEREMLITGRAPTPEATLIARPTSSRPGEATLTAIPVSSIYSGTEIRMGAIGAGSHAVSKKATSAQTAALQVFIQRMAEKNGVAGTLKGFFLGFGSETLELTYQNPGGPLLSKTVDLTSCFDAMPEPDKTELAKNYQDLRASFKAHLAGMPGVEAIFEGKVKSSLRERARKGELSILSTPFAQAQFQSAAMIHSIIKASGTTPTSTVQEIKGRSEQIDATVAKLTRDVKARLADKKNEMSALPATATPPQTPEELSEQKAKLQEMIQALEQLQAELDLVETRSDIKTSLLLAIEKAKSSTGPISDVDKGQLADAIQNQFTASSVGELFRSAGAFMRGIFSTSKHTWQHDEKTSKQYATDTAALLFNLDDGSGQLVRMRYNQFALERGSLAKGTNLVDSLFRLYQTGAGPAAISDEVVSRFLDPLGLEVGDENQVELKALILGALTP